MSWSTCIQSIQPVNGTIQTQTSFSDLGGAESNPASAGNDWRGDCSNHLTHGFS
jgi:hypothetical protein